MDVESSATARAGRGPRPGRCRAAIWSRAWSPSVEAGHPVADDVPHGGGHPGPRGRLLGQRSAVGEEPRQFPDEERVARGPGVDAAGDTGREVAAGLSADQLGDLGPAERPEPDPPVAGDAARRGERAAQVGAGTGARSRSAPTTVATRGRQSERGGRQLQGRHVGPLQVVDEEHDRTLSTATSPRPATTRSNSRNWASPSGAPLGGGPVAAGATRLAELTGQPPLARRRPGGASSIAQASWTQGHIDGAPSPSRQRPQTTMPALPGLGGQPPPAARSCRPRARPRPGRARCRRDGRAPPPGAARPVPRPGRPGGGSRLEHGATPVGESRRRGSTAPVLDARGDRTRRCASCNAGSGRCRVPRRGGRAPRRKTDSASAWSDPAAPRAVDEAGVDRLVQTAPRRREAQRRQHPSGPAHVTARSVAGTQAS